MKILFALNQNKETDVEEMLQKEYRSIVGEDFVIAKEYDLSGVVTRIKLENFDVVVLNEELERDNSITTTFIDDITDRFTDTRIIMIIKSDHGTDAYVKRLFNIGVYDLLYSHDITVENIVNLIISPRTKAEAKIYLDLHDIEDAIVESELKHIPEAEIFNIMLYFENINNDEYSQAFSHIVKQYNEEQIIFLINKLPDFIKNVLDTDQNEDYLHYMELISNRVEVKEFVKKEVENVQKDVKPAKGIRLPIFSKEIKEVVVEKIVTKVEKINIIPSDYKKTIVLVSPESTGKTEIASNLAVGLANNTDKIVALLDLDLDKFGVLYNFKVDPGEKGENYYKFKLFYNKIDKYLSGKEASLTKDEIKSLAVYQDKNLFVYSGSQGANIKDSGIIIGDTPFNDVLLYIIGEIRAISDILIIDLGSDMNNGFLSTLIDIGNVDKLLVANQNIETLNVMPNKLKMKYERNYDDWRLVINNYNPEVPVKEKEIISFFYDEDIEHLRYAIKSVNYIPYSKELCKSKAKREVVYYKDKEYKVAIDNLVLNIYPIEGKKRKKLFGII